MKHYSQRLFILFLGLAGGIVLGNQVSLAQQQESVPPLQDYRSPPTESDTEIFQRNERSSSSSDLLGNGFDPINLIHNANLRRSRGGYEFAEDTQNNLNKAAEEFKRQQQQQLQQMQDAPSSPAQP